MRALKFGGAALRTNEGFYCALNILNNLNDEKAVVVISALGSSTSELEKAAHFSEIGDFQSAIQVFDEILNSHSKRANELIPNIK